MPVHFDRRELEAVNRILEEVREHHAGLDVEHLIDIVVHEAQVRGIHPSISAPIARQLV